MEDLEQALSDVDAKMKAEINGYIARASDQMLAIVDELRIREINQVQEDYQKLKSDILQELKRRGE